jgi:hypothetical protein
MVSKVPPLKLPKGGVPVAGCASRAAGRKATVKARSVI